MITPSPEITEQLKNLNATFRFVHSGPIHGPNPHDESKVITIKPGEIRCEIFDKTVGELYFSEKGEDEAAALENAVKGALTAPKPLTPAQKNGASAVATKAIIDENASLKARLAELEAMIHKTPKKG